jgi:hypothetical protein
VEVELAESEMELGGSGVGERRKYYNDRRTTK